MTQNPADALVLLNELLQRDAQNPLLWVLSGRAHERQGAFFEAEQSLNKALELYPSYNEALYAKANIFYNSDRMAEAEIFLQDAIKKLNHEESRPLRSLLATVLQKQKKYELAVVAFEEMTREEPQNWLYWNNLGMIYQDLAEFEKMNQAYAESSRLSKNNPTPFYNHIVGSHYDPLKSAEEILALCKSWQDIFKPGHSVKRAVAKNKAKNKKLRIGMISDGLRSHPVGNMITLGLSHIPASQMEFYAYSTNFSEDHITHRIQRICTKWQVVAGQKDDVLDKMIRDDEIDILFDLCGYNANSRMPALQAAPAPIIIKWVGGLISSTGLKTMDYLLSDHVETPEGADALYTEKLIRLPGDYICYDPPYYLPALSEPPFKKKGYITFGCFNNASKINDLLLEQWAALLNNVPSSRLLLKSFNFKNESLREKVLTTMENHGIERERVILEGASPHKELLATYNDIDIALDPWPYSGGLTTCEAMAMGVPVVTLPGPTFAGRHSASHLVHGGMPELVAGSWQQYIDIATGMANDTDSLVIIRQHLRDVLLQSPVCDGQRFAQHFSDAMRAVWQRYCDGKAPEALHMTEGAQPYFADDGVPVVLEHPTETASVVPVRQDDAFEFRLNGKVMMMDYGGVFARGKDFIDLSSTNAIHSVIMDTLGEVEESHLPLDRKSIQHIQMHLLGNGDDTPVYMCLDSRYSSDLKALKAEDAAGDWAGQRVLTEITAASSKLDNIHGLDRLEWFVLDNRFNLRTVFQHATRVLNSCLLLAVNYRFVATHQGQMRFDEIGETLAQYGFTFHAFSNISYAAPLVIDGHEPLPSSKMVSAQLLFVPDAKRLAELSGEQREKLAFILYAGYKMRDAAAQVLLSGSTERAQAFLNNVSDATQAAPASQPEKKVVNIIPEVPRMSPAETELFERYVKQSTRYFEFGSGGSTKLATRNGIEVYGVESDKFWVDTLHKEAGPLCKVDYVDIGPTKEWGYPVDDSHKEKFSLYSEAILSHEQGFDFVLVDGRFRVACTLNAIKHALDTQQDLSATTIFIHDFWNRRDYHSVLEFLDTVEKAESAGVFKIKSGIDRAYMDRMLERFKQVAS
ncbi:O-linked N-acetylglucosamine transferase family protein [Erwinia sp. V71]|uniref:O-linked N-acetylglucosamine transferase, SPINDLY family protein n=1 Tax=Erwinia sp. V71 TaxID=3369424 RepID=UPI003F5F6756